MRSLILDNDALVHSRGLNLTPALEAVVHRLSEHAIIAHAVYMEVHKQGLGPFLEDWQKRGLLADPIDYRRLDRGEETYRKQAREWRPKGLSRPDVATLTVGLLRPSAAILTCERLLADAARDAGVVALDLFDVVHAALTIGYLTESAAQELCSPWQAPRGIGRPIDYLGTFDTERTRRNETRPLPALE